jgi:hypothetical protein
MNGAARALDLGVDAQAVERAEKADERAEQRQSLLQRIELLKLRTAGVGIVGFGLFVAALFSLLGQAPLVWAAWQSVGVGLAAIHVPSSLYAVTASSSRGQIVLQWTFFLIAVLGVSALSRGGVTALQERVWQVILVCVLCAAVVSEPSSTGDRKLHGELHRALESQDWDQAAALLLKAPDALKAKYVQAQISHQRADANAIREHGVALMVPLEESLLRMHSEDPADGDYLQASTIEFRLDVLERIDKATYGAAHSELSIARNKSHRTKDDSPWVRAFKSGATFALSIVGLLGSVATLVLWYRMNGRVSVVRKWATAGF